jgi:hypothetical protein
MFYCKKQIGHETHIFGWSKIGQHFISTYSACVYVNSTDILSEAELISEATGEFNARRLEVLQNKPLGIEPKLENS